MHRACVLTRRTLRGSLCILCESPCYVAQPDMLRRHRLFVHRSETFTGLLSISVVESGRPQSQEFFKFPGNYSNNPMFLRSLHLAFYAVRNTQYAVRLN